MTLFKTKVSLCFLLTLLPSALYAFGNAPPPPIRRTGVPVDGGITCTQCHTLFDRPNADPAGRVRIQAVNYRPGQTQTIRVTVEHPEAVRWGFQITARRAENEAQKAGTFIPNDSVTVRCDVPDPARTERGPMGPCGDRVEFASHANREATLTGGQGGRKTFEVEWTAPETDIGDVVFYVAGNAANDSGTNLGDRIYNEKLLVVNDGACTSNTRPIVTGVRNAGSGTSALAINTMMSIFGQNFFTPGNRRVAGPIDGLFRKELGCIAVEVNGMRAPVTYVDNNQINVQIPSITQLGNAQVLVILNPGRPNEVRGDVANVTLTSHAPAFFVFPGGNSIAALLPPQNTIVAAAGAFTGSAPAKPGDIVSLFATGLGPTDPFWQAGEVTSSTELARLPLDQLTVTVGGTTLRREDIQFAGLAPGQISALYQLNIRLPETLQNGDVPIVVRIGGMSTQAGATIPVQRPQ